MENNDHQLQGTTPTEEQVEAAKNVAHEAALVSDAEHIVDQILTHETLDSGDTGIASLVDDANDGLESGLLSKEDTVEADIVAEMLLNRANAPESAWALSRANDGALGTSLTVISDVLGPDSTQRIVDQVDASERGMADKLERQNFVKEAPLFSDVVRDASNRPLSITRIGDGFKQDPRMAGEEFFSSATLWGAREELAPFRETTTEGQAITEVMQVLDKTIEANGELADVAADMRDNLAYLGSKEYREATGAIASYWSELLDSNEATKLVIVTTGSVAPSYLRNNQQPKSDEFVLKNILAHFSEEERVKYTDRILLDPTSPDANDPNVRVILIDDQTISGRQLWDMREALPAALRDKTEANLLVSPAEYIHDGITYNQLKFGPENGFSTLEPLPVKSYYAARESSHNGRVKAYITGIHSTGDENFAKLIAPMAKSVDMPTPGLLNIVRPYTL